MNPRAIWSFVAGDSRLGPLLAAVAVGATVALVHFATLHSTLIGALFFVLVAVALVASVLETG
jgi:hypothetical protein